ncbi:MAG: phytanoyl-CoA dioxygenase family protein, partial [Planctomycetes bacterium]|nr:phytanoyl-CoA dioxygenase family protein [Planctomycetota bacterium]
MNQLSPTEIASYESEGYLVPDYRLPKERVVSLRKALDRVIESNPDTRPEQLVSAHLEQSAGEGVRGDNEFLE